MENFCRGCLLKYDPIEIIQYLEKNRRLFVYCTGLQVKRNDAFPFQLCKECFTNMKAASNFKKSCRNSDKKIKSYLELKESDDGLEFSTYIEHSDDAVKLRLPKIIGNSTPVNNKNQDDDESTCTSIQNFMTDILQADEIPDNEARIIRQVIEEEADILDDSLDSHWLQDVSVDSDFRLDFSISPFSTPRSINDIQLTPKNVIENKLTDKKVTEDFAITDTNYETSKNNPDQNIHDNIDNVINEEIYNESLKPDSVNNNMSKADKAFLLENLQNNDNFLNKPIFNLNEKDLLNEFNFNTLTDNKKCVIDVNLENALKNETNKVMLDDILSTPPLIPNISEPPTPFIKNILFGDKIETDSETANKIETTIIKTEDTEKDILDEFLKIDEKNKENTDIDIKSLIDIDEEEDINIYFNKPNSESMKEMKTSSPIENKFCITNFYCKMCDRQFKNLVALKVHCTKYHKYKIERPVQKHKRKKCICDYCGKVFQSTRCIEKHILNHQYLKTYECKKCTLTFSSEARLRQHGTVHTGIRIVNENAKKYVCTICGATCSSASNYSVHKRRHLKKFNIFCEECDKGFYRNSDLAVHMRQHTGEQPFECRYCPRRFKRNDVLSRHMKQHTGEKPFVCQFCGTKFCKNYDLKLHQSKSKSCLKKQMFIADEEKNKIIDDILVTNAYVF